MAVLAAADDEDEGVPNDVIGDNDMIGKDKGIS